MPVDSGVKLKGNREGGGGGGGGGVQNEMWVTRRKQCSMVDSGPLRAHDDVVVASALAKRQHFGSFLVSVFRRRVSFL